jgi:hypothetical protein
VLAPLLVALIWVVAIFTMASRPGGGLEPVLAGLIGGGALIVQACAGDLKGLRRVFGLRAPAAAGLALLSFAAGIALLLGFDASFAALQLVKVSGIDTSIAGAAGLLLRVGLALAVAAVVAQASGALIGDEEA